MTLCPTLAMPARIAAILALALLGACRDEEGAAHRSDIGPVPVAEQRPGDPEAGYDALVNAPYVSCGIPYDAFRRLVPETDAETRVAGRRGLNAGLPYAFTAHENEDGVTVVSSNCLTCHATTIGDELVIGLGNEFADFTQDPGRLALQAGTYVRGPAETEAWEHWADRIEGIAPYIRTATVGVNPAPNLTWALMAHRDPETLEWSDTPLIEPPPAEPLPISVPPWWGMRDKSAMFYTTVGRGDHATFMLLASMLCVESVAEFEQVDRYAADIRAYLASIEPPDYPFAIDAELAAEGAAIFARDCSECHGTYGEGASYPNRVYALDEIGTDPAYARAATDGSRDRFYEWIARSPYGDADSAAPAEGYIAPPLDGVWATAPYLHNGSVPDMASLIDPERRPAYWRHILPRAYDPDAIGWRHEALEAGQDAEADPELRRRIYDTTRTGYGNGGHRYGEDLDAGAAEALLEYLKTL
ncbi:c-type cytochrome [Roseibacterium sp. SDUM158017]|uniref:c-type cytochrome n=1 Tax=Roseicyclus salinarum TaxID=3036773 RepID=UPI002414F0C3|nr:c-type cytochrome [Roseibacterium sp. SDUM158017]MDG4648132.1 c-type cytochrome [Roseibacterium sp. SDUM158017]